MLSFLLFWHSLLDDCVSKPKRVPPKCQSCRPSLTPHDCSYSIFTFLQPHPDIHIRHLLESTNRTHPCHCTHLLSLAPFPHAIDLSFPFQLFSKPQTHRPPLKPTARASAASVSATAGASPHLPYVLSWLPINSSRYVPVQRAAVPLRSKAVYLPVRGCVTRYPVPAVHRDLLAANGLMWFS